MQSADAVSAPAGSPVELLALMSWKRRVFDLYGAARRTADPAAAWSAWRSGRDELFARHPQSPLPPADRASFAGLPYFDYDPAARVLADVTALEPATFDVPTSQSGVYRFTRFARASFALRGRDVALELYWLDGYGGGLWLPFADRTSGTTTYGAGRYVLDTIKGADLGMDGDRLVLDFNFSYNPSCAYDPRWMCPLAPPANRLAIEVGAGERT
jgi:uncharacterized protein (DUF1684 family)